MNDEHLKLKSHLEQLENINNSIINDKVEENNFDNKNENIQKNSFLLSPKNKLTQEKYVNNSEMINFKVLKNICCGNLEKCICKIKIEISSNQSYMGTGFFCKLKKNNIKLLLTNNHIIDNSFFSSNKHLQIEIDNVVTIIDLSIPRYKYTNIEFDFTIIEILQVDNISNFLSIDEDLIVNNYQNEQIFSLHYPRGNDLYFSSGKIIEINNYYLIYSISTDFGSSGCPIILINENIVIGIHLGYDTENEFNEGLSIEKIIKESNVINESFGNFYSINWEKTKDFLNIPISLIKDKNYFLAKIIIKNDGNLNFPNEIILKSENSDYFNIYEKENSERFNINNYLEINAKINILKYKEIISNKVEYKISLRIFSSEENIIIKNNNHDIIISFLEDKKYINNEKTTNFPLKYIEEIKKTLEYEFNIYLNENQIKEIIESTNLYKEKLDPNLSYDISQKIWEILKNK